MGKEAADLFEEGKFDEAGEKWWSLAEHAKATGNKTQECTALHNVGTSLVMMHELVDAVDFYNKALKLALETDQVSAQIELYECLGWVYRELGHAPNAVDCLNALCMLHEDTNNISGQVMATCSLGSIYEVTGNYPEAAVYYERALVLAEETKDDKVIARVLDDLGTQYIHVDELEKSESCYTRALRMATEAGDKDRIMRTCGNLAILCNLRDKDADAIDFFRRTIALASELEDKTTEMRASADLGLVLRANNEVQEAEELLKAAVVIAQDTSDVVAIGEHLTQLGVTALRHQEDAAGAESYLKKAQDSWRECAAILRTQLCETRLSAQVRNSDNPETVEFFDGRLDTFVLRQLALLAMGKENEALEVAEEAHGIATKELIALGGCDHREVGTLIANSAESARPMDKRLTVADLSAVASDAKSTIVMLTAVDDTTALSWVVNASEEAPHFRRLDCAPTLEAAGCTSIVQLVSKVHEAMSAAATLMACRGSPPSDPSTAGEAGASSAPPPPTLDSTAADAHSALAHLHRALISPLAEVIPAGAELVIIPSGVLSLVPFAALAAQVAPYEPLVASHAVSLAPSVAVFDALRQRASSAVRGAALVVGGAVPADKLGLRPLDFAKEEARAVAEELKKSAAYESVDLLCGTEATGHAVLERMVKAPPSLLHFAAHTQPKCVALGPRPEPVPSSTGAGAGAGAGDDDDDKNEDEDEDEGDDGLVHRDQVHLTWMPTHPVVALAGSHSASACNPAFPSPFPSSSSSRGPRSAVALTSARPAPIRCRRRPFRRRYPRPPQGLHGGRRPCGARVSLGRP